MLTDSEVYATVAVPVATASGGTGFPNPVESDRLKAIAM
jgi:hypothetical protein